MRCKPGPKRCEGKNEDRLQPGDGLSSSWWRLGRMLAGVESACVFQYRGPNFRCSGHRLWPRHSGEATIKKALWWTPLEETERDCNDRTGRWYDVSCRSALVRGSRHRKKRG